MDIRIEHSIAMPVFDRGCIYKLSEKQTYMKREEYPKFQLITPTKKYAIFHSTGYGVAEDNHVDVGFICECDNYDHIRGLQEKLDLAYNGFWDEHQTWKSFHFALKKLHEGKYQ